MYRGLKSGVEDRVVHELLRQVCRDRTDFQEVFRKRLKFAGLFVGSMSSMRCWLLGTSSESYPTRRRHLILRHSNAEVAIDPIISLGKDALSGGAMLDVVACDMLKDASTLFRILYSPHSSCRVIQKSLLHIFVN
jgi:hypothetical protein